VRLSKRLLLTVCAGVGVTGTGNRLVYKTSAEYDP